MLLAIADEVTLRLTDKEAQMVASWAMTRARADEGDKHAKAKMTALTRQMKTLAAQAKRGNAKAARTLLVLRESGLLERSQTLALDGLGCGCAIGLL